MPLVRFFRQRFYTKAFRVSADERVKGLSARIDELGDQLAEQEAELSNLAKRNSTLSEDLADSEKRGKARQAVIDAIYTETASFMSNQIMPIEGYNRETSLQAKQRDAREARKSEAISVAVALAKAKIHSVEDHNANYEESLIGDAEKGLGQRRDSEWRQFANTITKQTKRFDPVIDDGDRTLTAVGNDAGQHSVNECCIEPPAAEHVEEAHQRVEQDRVLKLMEGLSGS